MISRPIICLLFFIGSNSLQAQSLLDSLKMLAQNPKTADTIRVKALDDLCYEYLMIDQDSSLYFGRQAVALGRSINYSKGLAQSLSDLGVTLFYKGLLNDAIEAWEEALAIRTQLKDDVKIASLTVKLGAAYFKLGNFIKSMESQTLALKVFEKLNHVQGQRDALNNLAAIFEHQKEYFKALEYHRKARLLSKEISDLNSEGMTILNMGNIFFRTLQLDSAVWYWETALKYLSEDKSPQNLAIAYHNLSEYYVQQNQFVKARKYNDEALAIRQRINDYQGIVSSLNNQGNLLLKTGAFNQAEKAFKTALDSLKNKPLKIEEQKILGNLALLYEQSGQYKKALEEYKRYIAVKDTLLNESTRNNTNELLIRYETEKKETQLAFQKVELEQQKTQLSQFYLLVATLIVMIGLLIIIAILARSRYKRNIQLKEKEKQISVREAYIDATLQSQEAERKRVAQDLHDGMGQLITTLRFTLNKLSPNSSVEDRIMAMKKSEDLLNDMHKEVRAVAFNLMPQTLIQSGLIPALREMALRIMEQQTVRIDVTAFDMDNRLEDVQEISLYRITQEWINNVLKYASPTQIEINFVRNESHLSVTIEDDGVGFDPSMLQNSKGHGWKNILSRASLIRSQVEVDSRTGVKGSTFLIHLPLSAYALVENTHQHG